MRDVHATAPTLPSAFSAGTHAPDASRSTYRSGHSSSVASFRCRNTTISGMSADCTEPGRFDHSFVPLATRVPVSELTNVPPERTA